MRRRIFELFHREFRGVREAAFLLALATIVSNLLALLRDRLLASRFGAGIELDMYYAAFRVPDLLYAFSLFFVASTAIIPLFLERFSEGEQRAQAFFDTVFSVFVTSVILLAIVAYVSMPFIVPFYVPGFDTESKQEVIAMSRILLVSQLFLGLSSLLSSILQSFRKFFVYAATFLFYNIGIIFGAVVMVNWLGEKGLVWGVVFGSVLHLVIQLYGVYHAGYRYEWSLRWTKDLGEVLRLMFPRVLSLGITQINFIAMTVIGSYLTVGSLTILTFAYNIQF